MLRIGDVPHVDGCLVVSLDEQRRSVRRPPEAAEPVELLGGDELGPPPHLGGRLGLDDRALIPTGDAHDPQPAVGGVGDVAAFRVHARVDDRSDGRQPGDRAAGEVDGPRTPGQGERRPSPGVVDVEVDQAGAGLPAALAAGPFLVRQLLLGVALDGQRVDDDGLGAGGDVVLPELAGARHPVGRADVPDLRPVG
jgi:hypothetical protein